MTAKKDEFALGVGIDIGTMNIVSARRTTSGKVITKRVRDAFLDLDLEAKRSLKMSRVDYVEQDEALVVIGDSALTMANLFKREARRPLSRGVIAAGEVEAQSILGLLIHHVLEEPTEEKEFCFYSVPAAPIDDPSQDVIFHTEIFRKIINDRGYTARPTNEAMAIIFSQCATEKFSGLSVSFGAGMTNVALAYNASSGMEFSLARCLAEDFPVVTSEGIRPIKEVQVNDRVLDAHGEWVSVLGVLNNGPRDTLLRVSLENLPSFPVEMTKDHRLFVRGRFGWDWKEAKDLIVGDRVGVPTIRGPESGQSHYFGRKNDSNITVSKGRNLGRLFGVFLGDGSCGPFEVDPEFVQLAFNRRDAHLVDKYTTVLTSLFGRFSDNVGGFGVGIGNNPSENVTRVKLHSTVVARYMKSNFYRDGVKVCPLDISEVPNQMALGILEGLLDSDTTEEPKSYTISNTSQHIVLLAHHILNRFGIEHSIIIREPRLGGVNSKGVQIVGRLPTYELKISGHIAKTLLDTLLRIEGHQIFDRFPEFMEYTVKDITEVPYGKDVFDLQVDSKHHSFCSWGLIVHNCGDWVDAQSARAVGKTASQMCSIKEKGIDLQAPNGREEQALVLYLRSLINYALLNIGAQFKKVRNEVSLPEAVPFIVSGGTSKAVGFLDLFREEFEAIRKKFPIEISEIRHATDPLTAVAEGLLVLATEEHAG